METLVAIGVAILGIIAAYFGFRKKSKTADERDKRIILREDKIKEAKEKIKKVRALTEDKNKEFKDALSDYNNKYRPGK